MSVVLAISNAEPDSVRALDQAIALAKSMDTGLRVLFALPDPANAMLYASSELAVGVGPAAVTQVQAAQKELGAEIEAMLAEARSASGLADDKIVFDRLVGSPRELAPDAAMMSDATVFSRAAAASGDLLSSAFERVLMDYRLPVVLSGTSAPKETGPALIAWNGGPEAARAVMLNDAVIRTAGSAVIVQNAADLGHRKESEAADPEKLAAWLRRRGVAAETATLEGDVADGLLAACAERGARFLVMGAYGHSRAGEFLFGGVTRSLLKADTCPALALAH